MYNKKSEKLTLTEIIQQQYTERFFWFLFSFCFKFTKVIFNLSTLWVYGYLICCVLVEKLINFFVKISDLTMNSFVCLEHVNMLYLFHRVDKDLRTSFQIKFEDYLWWIYNKIRKPGELILCCGSKGKPQSGSSHWWYLLII